jgi:hypothetical protein
MLKIYVCVENNHYEIKFEISTIIKPQGYSYNMRKRIEKIALRDGIEKLMKGKQVTVYVTK